MCVSGHRLFHRLIFSALSSKIQTLASGCSHKSLYYSLRPIRVTRVKGGERPITAASVAQHMLDVRSSVLSGLTERLAQHIMLSNCIPQV
jgi:hypothetical protein